MATRLAHNQEIEGSIPSLATNFMTVLPPQYIPPQIQRYTNTQPPANLVVLATKKVGFGPEGTDGSAMPDDKISPYSGIYDESGHLPSLSGPGCNFIAHA